MFPPTDSGPSGPRRHIGILVVPQVRPSVGLTWVLVVWAQVIVQKKDANLGHIISYSYFFSYFFSKLMAAMCWYRAQRSLTFSCAALSSFFASSGLLFTSMVYRVSL